MSPLLDVRGLTRRFPFRDGLTVITAVDGVSFSLAPGETLGIVGESGCGKSTLARLILRLIAPSEGSVLFEGLDIGTLSAADLRRKRRDMQIVFQDPYAALDARMTIGAIVAEPLEIHGVGTRASRRERCEELMSLVGMPREALARYPHEFSGGQRQRIAIARAIALEPKLLILDEPVSALDVSIQSQILNLLQDLKKRLNLSCIFISHDLGVVEYMSDRVAVMYLGRIVELAPAADLFAQPLHPYTRALISAVPDLSSLGPRERVPLAGDPPSLEFPPSGCAFNPRCIHAFATCVVQRPPLHRELDGGRLVACHLYPLKRT
jgi:oligopeptide/dipeptide ABC transporter ATP-binding protein